MGHVSIWVLANMIFPVVVSVRWVMVSLGESRATDWLKDLDEHNTALPNIPSVGGWLAHLPSTDDRTQQA